MLWNPVAGVQPSFKGAKTSPLSVQSQSVSLTLNFILILCTFLPILFVADQHLLLLPWFIPLCQLSQHGASMCHVELSGFLLHSLTLHFPAAN